MWEGLRILVKSLGRRTVLIRLLLERVAEYFGRHKDGHRGEVHDKLRFSSSTKRQGPPGNFKIR